MAQRRIQLAVTGSARRIQDWAGEMALLAQGFGTPGGVPVQHMLGAMLGRMGETLMDLKQLVDLSWHYEPGGEACSVQHCPRLETLPAAPPGRHRGPGEDQGGLQVPDPRGTAGPHGACGRRPGRVGATKRLTGSTRCQTGTRPGSRS